MHNIDTKQPLGHGAARKHKSERAMLYRTFTKLLNDESGATSIEYSLIAILVSLAVFLTLTSLGGALAGSFSVVSDLTDQAAASVAAGDSGGAASTRCRGHRG